MDERMRELIAIGASVTANCVACFRYHEKKAREQGADSSQIQEAVRVGRTVRRGAASTWDKETSAALGERSSA